MLNILMLNIHTIFKLPILTQEMDSSFDGTFTDPIRSNAYKVSNPPKKNKVSVNLADTQYAVVKHVSKKNKYNLSTQPILNMNWDLCWTDNHVKTELFVKMGTHQKINHFPGMGILSRKNNLGTNLMHFRKRFPADYEFFPITWSLPQDYAELLAYHESRQPGKAQTFIVKPQASCQGRGIYLTRNIDRIKYDRCVVQRYMHKPYLIDGLKFDLRIYVLLGGIDPLRIYVYEEGLARLATEEYRPPRSQNLQNKFMHLTNYAINKQNPNFIFNESVQKMNIGHKRSLTSVYQKIAEEGHDVEQLKARIYDLFIKTIITGYPTLSATCTAIHPDNFANDMCFQLLGFDVMLDHKLNPYLLEINYTPSFTTDTPLDCYIKKKLISDTLNLMGVNEKWKKQAKAKREKEIQQRMVSGKRKKWTNQEKKMFIAEQAKKRNQYEARNLGGFTKIFLLNEDQMQQYRKYYDFAMELYNQSLVQSNQSGLLMHNTKKKQEFVYYHHYFGSGWTNNQTQTIVNPSKKQKQQKNASQIMRQSKANEANTLAKSTIHDSNRNDSNIHNHSNNHGYHPQSLNPSANNKRATSAKSRKEQSKQRKVVYDRIGSKKSLKGDRGYGGQEEEGNRNNGHQYDGFVMENNSIFQNRNLQQLLSKQRRGQTPNDESFSREIV